MPQRPLTGFDLDASYRTRTPRRDTGYAAQVWAATGSWDLGTYPTRIAAQNACRLFAGTSPAEGASSGSAHWHPHRSGSHAPDDCYKFGDGKGRAWVRRVKGNAWQSRPWISGFGNINLGLFTQTEFGDGAQNRAVRLSKAFDAEWQGLRTVADAVDALKRRPDSSWERVAPHITVPLAARNLLRPPPRTPAEVERAEALAARFPVDLWGSPVTAAELLEGWGACEDRREEYAREFQEALDEGEPFEEAVAILVP